MFNRPALLALLASSFCVCVAPAHAAEIPAAGEPCQGTLELGAKTYKLKYAVAYTVKVFDDVGTAVLFAEQPIQVEKLRAALRDGDGSADKFFFFKPHVTVTFDKTGRPMFCNAYGDNFSASVGGTKLTGELTIKDGRSIGGATLATDADDAANRKSGFSVPAFDLTTLVVPAAAPKAPAKDEDAPAADVEKPAKNPKSPSKSKDPAPAADAIPHTKLPLPDDATDVEYKKLVGHIKCKSPSDYKSVARTLTKKLADQGWKTVGSDLVGPKSAILKRKRGTAELTIFVKPAEAGSTVMIMSEGLAWEE